MNKYIIDAELCNSIHILITAENKKSAINKLNKIKSEDLLHYTTESYISIEYISEEGEE